MTYMDEYRDMAQVPREETPDPTTLIHEPIYSGESAVRVLQALTGNFRGVGHPITVSPLCGSTKGATGPGVTCPTCKAMKEEIK